MGKHRIKTGHNGRVSALGRLDSNPCTQFVCGANFDVCYDKLKVMTPLREAPSFGICRMCRRRGRACQACLLNFDVQAATGPTVGSFTEGWIGSLLPSPVDNGQQWSVTTVDHSRSLVDQNRTLGGAEPWGPKAVYRTAISPDVAFLKA